MKILKIFTIAALTSVALAPLFTKIAFAQEFLNPHEGSYLGATFGANSKGASIKRNPSPGRFDVEENSVGFGIVGGYNWIFNDRFMLGIEGDIGTAGGDFTKTDATLGSINTTGKFVGSIRGRAGIAWDQALFYGTAGLAFSDIAVRPTGAPKKNQLSAGIVFGAGMEYALSDDWSARVEGLVYGFGNDKTKFAGLARETAMGVATIRLGILKRF